METTADISLTDDLLVFGYGSLVWRPSLPFTASHPSTVAGYVRRLWQQSPDHRGVPGATGRVATLVPLPGSAAVTAGTVFTIPARDAAAALTSLVEREIAGYAAVQVVAMGDDGVALQWRSLPRQPMSIGPVRGAGGRGCLAVVTATPLRTTVMMMSLCTAMAAPRVARSRRRLTPPRVLSVSPR